eukprot:scaffold73298_cov40-Phaeocystis_antarctica.AAC.2
MRSRRSWEKRKAKVRGRVGLRVRPRLGLGGRGVRPSKVRGRVRLRVRLRLGLGGRGVRPRRPLPSL